MTNIYFVRHGQSQANLDGTIAGWIDAPLTKLGIEQAEQEAEFIKKRHLAFDLIVASSLSRSYDTAVIIARSIGYPAEKIVVLDDLRERNCGDFEGRPRGELFEATLEEQELAHVESFTDFAIRIQNISHQVAQMTIGTTLVVGHAGFYRVADALSQGRPPEDGIKMPTPDNGKLLEYPL